MTEKPKCNRKITGMENIPGLNKFRVHLDCGHTIICDHAVSDVKIMVTVACPLCEEGKPA